MCIWIFFYLHDPSLQLRRLPLVVLWQYQSDHSRQPTGVECYHSDENIIIMENTISDIIMNNVIVIVLIMIIALLVLSLANMKMNILEKSLFSVSHELLYSSLFLLYFSFLFIFVILFLYLSLLVCITVSHFLYNLILYMIIWYLCIGM